MVLAATIYPHVISYSLLLRASVGFGAKGAFHASVVCVLVHKDGHEARADTTMFIFAEIYTHYSSFKIERIY